MIVEVLTTTGRVVGLNGTVATDGSIQLPVAPGFGSIARSTAGGPAPGQVAKNYSGLVTLTGSPQTITLETVPVGRTYLVTDIIATTTSAAALLFSLQSAGVTTFQFHINSTKGCEAVGLETQPSCAASQALAVLVPAGTGAVAYNIFGIEN